MRGSRRAVISRCKLGEMEEAARKKTSILLEEPENRREPLLIAARDMANPRNMERKQTLARCEWLYLPSIFRYLVIYHSDFRTMARAVVCYVCLTNVHISRNRAAYRKPPTALHCGRIPVIHVASYPGGNGAVYRFYTRINILLSLTPRSKRSLRSMERLRVAFLGPAGSFSHQVRNFCSTCGQE